MSQLAVSELHEADFQQQILDLAKLLSWRRAHFRPAKTNKGWRTPVAGDGKGFPDLLLIRGPRLVIAELKTEKGKTRPEQDEWLDAWRQIACAEVFVWRPSMFDEIAQVLR